MNDKKLKGKYKKTLKRDKYHNEPSKLERILTKPTTWLLAAAFSATVALGVPYVQTAFSDYIKPQFQTLITQKDNTPIPNTKTPYPTEIPPTPIPPTEIPPTTIPPTEIPPTKIPPTPLATPDQKSNILKHYKILNIESIYVSCESSETTHYNMAFDNNPDTHWGTIGGDYIIEAHFPNHPIDLDYIMINWGYEATAQKIYVSTTKDFENFSEEQEYSFTPEMMDRNFFIYCDDKDVKMVRIRKEGPGNSSIWDILYLGEYSQIDEPSYLRPSNIFTNSKSNGGTEPWMGFDGDPDTYWGAADPNMDVILKYKDPIDLQQIKINWGYGPCNQLIYFSISDDGESFSDEIAYEFTPDMMDKDYVIDMVTTGTTAIRIRKEGQCNCSVWDIVAIGDYTR